MKRIFIILLILNSIKSIGCSCGVTTFSQQFINADIVAKVKIIKVNKVWNGENDYGPYSIEFETIELYKGIQKSNILNLPSFSDASCGIYLSLNSEWIIFAYSNSTENQYNTSLCSGSKQIDAVYDEDIYPNYSFQYKKSIQDLTKLLLNLKANNIEISNKTNIFNSCSYYNFLKTQNDLKTNSEYAFYKVIFDSELTIKKIKTINGFNRKFDKALKKEIIQNSDWISIYGKNKKISENPEWLIIIKRNNELTYDNLKYNEIKYYP